MPILPISFPLSPDPSYTSRQTRFRAMDLVWWLLIVYKFSKSGFDSGVPLSFKSTPGRTAMIFLLLPSNWLISIPSMRFLLFAGVSCLFQRALASLANVTIDDTFGDPQTGARIVYSPVSAWENGAQACSTSCAARPDPRQLCNGTWHETIFISHSGDSKDDSSQIPSASVTFSGQFVCAHILQ